MRQKVLALNYESARKERFFLIIKSLGKGKLVHAVDAFDLVIFQQAGEFLLPEDTAFVGLIDKGRDIAAGCRNQSFTG